MQKKIGIIIALLVGMPLNAAVFTLENKSTKAIFVHPICSPSVCLARTCADKICGVQDSGKVYDHIVPGGSIRYDTGGDGVVKFEWGTKNGTKRTIYTVSVRVWALNLGGRFTIFDDGKYSYSFGVDGPGEGVAEHVDLF